MGVVARAAGEQTAGVRRLLGVVAVAVLAVVVLPGCEPADLQLSVDGRRVLVHRHTDNATRPLVLVLHGYTNDAPFIRSYTGLDATADALGFNVAYPEGTPTSPFGFAWNAGICCGGSSADDVSFLEHVVNRVASGTPTDRRRIYVWGFSNGAMMAIRATCEAEGSSGKPMFAAAGAVGGPALVTSCRRPVWRHLHGEVDTVVPVRGGPSSVPSVCGCTFPDSTTEPGRFGPFADLDLFPTGGHTWPKPADGTFNVDANRLLWDFSRLFTVG
jgi:poly(3-hydroxybutyrate) depolymerase